MPKNKYTEVLLWILLTTLLTVSLALGSIALMLYVQWDTEKWDAWQETRRGVKVSAVGATEESNNPLCVPVSADHSTRSKQEGGESNT